MAETITFGAAMITIFNAIGQGPLIAIIFAVVIGPWIMAFFLFRASEKTQEKRFGAVSEMYENNVRLVENYEHLSQEAAQANSDQRAMIMMSTAELTKLQEKIQTNQYCPRVRRDGRNNA